MKIIDRDSFRTGNSRRSGKKHYVEHKLSSRRIAGLAYTFDQIEPVFGQVDGRNRRANHE